MSDLWNAWVEEYDLFVSYSRRDDQGEYDGFVSAIVDEIRADLAEFSPAVPLKVFFDIEEIRSAQDWRERLRSALRQSKTMVAILSPSYFASEYCRWEWEEYLRAERWRTYPGEALTPIFVIEPKELSSAIPPAAREWWEDLAKRNGVEIQSFWKQGREALREEALRQRIVALKRWAVDRAAFGRELAAVPREMSLRNPNFVGREKELRELRQALGRREAVSICAVHGIGGIGKSSLAREYAYRFRPEYLGGQFEIDLSNVTSPEILKSRIVALANARLRPHDGKPLIDPKLPEDDQFLQAKNDIEHRPNAKRVLLILDNLDEDAAELVSARNRSLCLPSPEKVDVLVTTRLGPGEVQLPSVSVDRLGPAEALDVLLQYRTFGHRHDDPEWIAARQENDPLVELAEIAPDLADEQEWKAALAIANRLGRHTLAVAMVGAYLGSYDISYRRFLSDMVTHGIGLALEHVGKDEHVRQLLEHPQTLIGELFERSLARLNEKSPLPLRILEYAAYLPPDAVFTPWIRTLIESDGEMAEARAPKPFADEPIDAALRQLADLQMLVGDRERRMHRVLQEVVSARMEASDLAAHADAVCRLAKQRAFAIAGSPFDSAAVPEIESLTRYVRLATHVDDFDVALIKQSLVRVLSDLGRWSDARRLSEESHKSIKRAAQSDRTNSHRQRELAVSYSTMGRAAFALGDSAKAGDCYRSAMAIHRRLANSYPNDCDRLRDLSVSYDRLGDLHFYRRDLKKAAEYYGHALTLLSRLAEALPDAVAIQVDLASSADRLGDLHRIRGAKAKAQLCFDRALAIRSRFADQFPQNQDMQFALAVSLERRGDTHRSSGKEDEARRDYESALAIRERMAQAAPENAAWQRALFVTLTHLGDLHVSLREGPQALERYEDAVRIAHRLASSAPENAVWQRDLASGYFKLGILFGCVQVEATSLEFYRMAADLLSDLEARNALHSPEDKEWLRQLRRILNRKKST